MMGKHVDDPGESDVTPQETYLNRRQWLKNSAAFIATTAGVGGGLYALSSRGEADAPSAPTPLEIVSASRPPSLVRSPYDTDEEPTSFKDVSSYNNFYELGLSKSDPARNAHMLKTRPWTVSIEGEVERPQVIDIDTLKRWFGLEQRIYRMRCVEAWSMVIPWLGFPLASLIKRLNPTSRAKYIAFETIVDPTMLPGQRLPVLDWPYREGLRIDEAVHPLSMLAVGLYGGSLPAQNGAPIRLVVPWKYGFKGIKSIVKITFQASMPPTSWNLSAPKEYGFYANVNPSVDHPRWSQATERRIGQLRRIPTQMFNGYADRVAHLYQGMNLERWY